LLCCVSQKDICAEFHNFTVMLSVFMLSIVFLLLS